MRDYTKFYIDGKWVDPVTPKTLDVINPATEEVAGRISLERGELERAYRSFQVSLSRRVPAPKEGS